MDLGQTDGKNATPKPAQMTGTRKVNLTLFLLLAVLLPVTVFVSGQQQELRKFAQSNTQSQNVIATDLNESNDVLINEIKKYNSYKNVPIYNKNIEQKITSIIIEREKLLLSKAYENPGQLLDVLLPQEIVAQAPPNLQQELDSTVGETGILREVHRHIGGHQIIDYFLDKNDSSSLHLIVNAEQLGKAKPGSQIKVDGIQIQTELFVTQPIEVLSTPTNVLGSNAQKVTDDKQGDVLGTRNEVAKTVKVYAISFVPFINGKKMWEHYGWNNPDTLLPQVQNAINQSSNGRVHYTISRKEEYPIFNTYIDGFTHNPQTFEECRRSGYNPSVCHQPWSADYVKILRDYDVCGKVNRGEIDELWLYGAGGFGYWESATTGPKAYGVNGGVIENVNGCSRIIAIMGFNYEVGWDQAVHAYGHRIEGIMSTAYGGWEENRTSHNWDRFGLNKVQSPNYTYSGCGSIHYPPNGGLHTGGAYEYHIQSNVKSMCDDFYRYPDFHGELTAINCQSWNCNPGQFYQWWNNHIPSFDGIGPDGRYNNWWKYITNLNAVFEQVLPPTPSLPANAYSNLKAVINSPNVAQFSFSFAGHPNTFHFIDLATDPNMRSLYWSFAGGNGTFIAINNPNKWTEVTCGKTLYWRVRPSDHSVHQVAPVTVTCGTNTPLLPTPTPFPLFGEYSSLSAQFSADKAIFNFSYSGFPVDQYIDVSTSPTMEPNTFIAFAYGSSSPISVNNPTSKWSVYTCGKTLYWRLRQGTYGSATKLSTIQTNTVNCGATPSPTPTATPTRPPTPTSTRIPTPTLTKTPTPTVTRTPTPTRVPTPSPTRIPTPTVIPINYSSFGSTLRHPSPAIFNFIYSGPAAEHHIDLSTRPDMGWDVYVDFAVGNNSVITVTNPTKWAGVYACGRTLYWRVRQVNGFISGIQSAIVYCDTIPTIVPTRTPTPFPTATPTRIPTTTPIPTRTPTPMVPIPSTNEAQRIQLHLSAVGTQNQFLYVIYTQSTETPTYVTHSSQNVNLHSDGFTSIIPGTTEIRPLNRILGNLKAGDSIRLCTGNYSACSNKVTIIADATLGVSTENTKLQPKLWDIGLHIDNMFFGIMDTIIRISE